MWSMATITLLLLLLLHQGGVSTTISAGKNVIT
jgi:hypothetical protein